MKGLYNSDFVARVYSNWLAAHPSHFSKGARLLESIASGQGIRARQAMKHGIEIPETLAISLTSACNLSCGFCAVADAASGSDNTLPRDIVERLLDECADLGIRRIALVGGEPTMAPGFGGIVADHPDFFFSVFTNGMLLDESLLETFECSANYALIVNVSATMEKIVAPGVGSRTRALFRRMTRRGLFFGYAATVHHANRHLFENARVLEELSDLGARFGILFDYLSEFEEKNDPKSVTPEQRRKIVEIARDVGENKGTMIIAAPEDEALMGGCAAAGRKVVHVNARGEITPCPLVLYSSFNIADGSLLESLTSEYFRELRDKSHSWENSAGPCAYRAAVEEFVEVNERHGARRV